LTAVARRLEELAGLYALPPGAAERLERLLTLVAAEPASITAVRDPRQGVEAHVADALAGLALAPVRSARRIADLGAGGGFPGLVLAVALPDAHVALVESAARKCAFLRAAAEDLGLGGSVEVVEARAEDWPAGLGAHDLVTARALALLTVLLEYAAPLLATGGSLVAWKGRRSAAEEADGAAAAERLGMSAPEALAASAVRGAERHLYLSSKVSSTPNEYPRRPGMARKRPIRASTEG